MPQKIVIIGSGLAGYSLAKEFRQLNKEAEVVLITADHGDYYSKPQLSTAFNLNKTANDLLMNTADQMAEKLQMEVVTNKIVRNIDRDNRRVLADNYTCQYDQLVLALGADKLMAPLSGDAINDVQSVNTLEEYAAFRAWLNGKKRIAILGSGLVGCEFANDLATGGFDVEVMAPDHYPLQRFVPQMIGEVLKDALSEKGVKWHLCRFASEVNSVGDGYEVVFDNMDKIKVDGVFSAIGLKPRTQLAELAHLTVEKGVVTNALLQTSDPNIYALGDCAEVCGQVRLHIAPLLACARALAKTLNGTETPVHYPAMPILVKTPACAITACPPYLEEQHEWCISGDSPNLEAQCVDSAGNLLGFALSGNAAKRRVELLKLLPDLF